MTMAAYRATALSDCGSGPCPVRQVDHSDWFSFPLPKARYHVPMTIRLDPADNVVTATRTLEAGTTVDDVVTTAIIPRNTSLQAVTSRLESQCENTPRLLAMPPRRSWLVGMFTRITSNSATPRKITRFPLICARLSPSPRQRAIALWISAREWPRRHPQLHRHSDAGELLGYSGAHDRVGFRPEEMANYPNVDGVVAFVHGTGCGMAGQGEGFEALQRVLGLCPQPEPWGCAHGRACCEMNQIDWLLEACGLKQGPLFKQ